MNFKNILLIAIITVFFQGCFLATKTKELGGGISNINHPVALGVGIGLYNLGRVLEDDKTEKKEKQ